jgi:2-polyprenyl-6-methoxyphenol hydroxylase-like FAD-dependent oxidoreductase
VKIAIVGGGAAGLFAALLLARSGHEVVLFEQDRLDLAPDPESAAMRAFRWTAPQIVQPHIVMAKCRALLRERLPDVYAALLRAGVAEAPLSTQMPSSLSDRTILAGDEHLAVLMTRRSTFDWVLQRAVLDEPFIRFERGVHVNGLLAVNGDPPHVTGVCTDRGNYTADLVVDAAGRRSPIDRWLASIGARPSATWWAECGVAYFSRHYRLRDTADLPGLPTTRAVVGLDEFTVGIWGADNRIMQLVVAPLAEDRRFRTLRDPEIFTAVVRSVPSYAKWLDVLEPISPVFPMGGLHNTLRRMVVGGAPVVTGLHALGDSVCTTNPTLGRGLSLALWGAADLVDVIELYADDWSAQAVDFDARIGEHIAPFYEDQAAIDAARLAMLRHAIFNAPAPIPSAGDCERITYAELRIAAQVDPVAFRAFWALLGMLRLPEDVYADPRVVATRAALREYTAPFAQPDRAQLLAALGVGNS